jgi:hypothetical protein
MYLWVYHPGTLPIVDIVEPISGVLLQRIANRHSVEQMVLCIALLKHACVLLTYADACGLLQCVERYQSVWLRRSEQTLVDCAS